MAAASPGGGTTDGLRDPRPRVSVVATLLPHRATPGHPPPRRTPPGRKQKPSGLPSEPPCRGVGNGHAGRAPSGTLALIRSGDAPNSAGGCRVHPAWRGRPDPEWAPRRTRAGPALRAVWEREAEAEGTRRTSHKGGDSARTQKSSSPPRERSPVHAGSARGGPWRLRCWVGPRHEHLMREDWSWGSPPSSVCPAPSLSASLLFGGDAQLVKARSVSGADRLASNPEEKRLRVSPQRLVAAARGDLTGVPWGSSQPSAPMSLL